MEDLLYCIVGWWLPCLDILLSDGDTLRITALCCCFVSRLRCEKGDIDTLSCVMHFVAFRIELLCMLSSSFLFVLILFRRRLTHFIVARPAPRQVSLHCPSAVFMYFVETAKDTVPSKLLWNDNSGQDTVMVTME